MTLYQNIAMVNNIKCNVCMEIIYYYIPILHTTTSSYSSIRSFQWDMLVTLSQEKIMRDPPNFKYSVTKSNPKYLSSHLILLMWLSGLEGMIFESLRGYKCNNILHVHYYAQIISGGRKNKQTRLFASVHTRAKYLPGGLEIYFRNFHICY